VAFDIVVAGCLTDGASCAGELGMAFDIVVVGCAPLGASCRSTGRAGLGETAELGVTLDIVVVTGGAGALDCARSAESLGGLHGVAFDIILVTESASALAGGVKCHLARGARHRVGMVQAHCVAFHVLIDGLATGERLTVNSTVA
jgi:hypothetical protein